MGSDAHHAEEAPGRPVDRRRASAIDTHAVTNAQFAAFVARHGYVTVAERPLDPADFPGAPAENLSARLDGVPAHARAGRPAPDGPVVGVDAGRVLAAPGRAAQLDRRPRASIRSSTSRTRTRAPTPSGRARAADRGASGRSPPAAASTARRTPGATTPERARRAPGQLLARRLPVARRRRATARPRPSARSRPTATASSTWPATSGSGRATGTGAPSRASTPSQPQFAIPRRVVKGGSFLCADSYCPRYRPAARRPQMIDTGMSHIGFRCVRS